MPVTFEQLMEVPYVRRYIELGAALAEARGMAYVVIRVLNERGLSVSPEAEERIRSCTDHEMLENWIGRALKADSVDELFEEVEEGAA
ncbi:hypothetical protein [Nonomuraea sp. NPDC049504]|uniref:hypothetical protein n=1 Tax=Nonomuraea sp. NPDC049504 TaxID=3154729 RepID=UPI00343F0C41